MNASAVIIAAAPVVCDRAAIQVQDGVFSQIDTAAPFAASVPCDRTAVQCQRSAVIYASSFVCCI